MALRKPTHYARIWRYQLKLEGFLARLHHAVHGYGYTLEVVMAFMAKSLEGYG